MTLITVAAEVYRDYGLDGVPSSGPHDPKKTDIRRLLGGYEQVINAFTAAGGLIYDSLDLLGADLDKPANSLAWVIADVAVANNGVYRKNGASGSGSWTRVADLPYSFIVASNVGAGTANAIQATTDIPISSSALIVLNVFEANGPGAVTVSFNGGAALTIKTNSGNDPVEGGLVAGMIVLGYVSGTVIRLISDQVSSAIVAAAEAAAAAAAISAATVDLPSVVPGSKGKGLTVNAAETGYEFNLLPVIVQTRTDMKALPTAINRPAFLTENGRQGAFILRSGTPPATDSQEGVYVISSTSGFYWERIVEAGLNVLWFGAVGDDTVQCAPAFNSAVTVAKFLGKKIFAPAGIYRFNAAVTIDASVSIEGEGWQPYKLYPGGTIPSTRGGGTWFHITHTNAPLFNIVRPSGGRCSGVFLKSFGMFQDHPAIGVGWAPTIYDFCIKATSVDDVFCESLYFHGCYRAVQMTGSLSLPAGRLRCKQILGQVFSLGIDLDFSVDVSVLDDIHFWPFWSDNANVLKWQRTNGTAIRSARNDNAKFSNIFAYGYRTGLLMTGTAGVGVTSRLLANNLGFDDCPRGFHFTSAGAGGTASFSDCYVAANPVAYGGGEPNADLMIVEGINYIIRFSNLRLSNSQANAVFVNAAGCDVMFVNSWFDQWNISGAGFAGINVAAGSNARLSNNRATQGNGSASSGGAGTINFV